MTRNGFKIDLVFFQIWSGWIPSSSRSGSSSSKLVAPPIGPVPPPIGPAVFVAEDPISKDIKGIPEFDGREGWNGAVGTRRCWIFPPVATVGFPPDGKITGGTPNSLAMFFDFERKLGFLDQWIRDLVMVFLLDLASVFSCHSIFFLEK